MLKASQAISGEIVLERLLATLLDIIVENAGAESAVLALENENEHLIQGVKSAGEKARVMMAEPLRHSVAVSKGIVNFVIRTSEHVVLADPALRGKFRNDPYVRNRHPKSVLCAPVSHKGKSIGIIYFENNQVSGAFTPNRLEALNILLAQIAVSIENATLYATQGGRRARSRPRTSRSRKKSPSASAPSTSSASTKITSRSWSRSRHEEELENTQGRLVDMSRRAGRPRPIVRRAAQRRQRGEQRERRRKACATP